MKDQRANLKVPPPVRDKLKSVATYHKTTLVKWIEQKADEEIKKHKISIK